MQFSHFSFYILRSVKTGSYYIGSTENITRRLFQHNHGLVESTKFQLPWLLIHVEHFDNLSDSRQREVQVKKWKSRAAIDRLIEKA